MTTTDTSQGPSIGRSESGAAESTASLTNEGVMLSPRSRDTLGFDAAEGMVPISALIGTGPSLSVDGNTCPLGSWIAMQLQDSNLDAKLLRAVTLPNQRFTALVQPAQVRWEISQAQSPLSKVRHELGNRINNIHVNAELISLWARQADDDRLLEAAGRILEECARSHAFATEQLDPDNLEGAHPIPVSSVMPSLLVTAQADEPSLRVRVRHRPLITSALVLQTAHFLNRVAQVSHCPIQASFERAEETESSLHIAVSGLDSIATVAQNIVAEWEGHHRAEPSLLALPPTITAFQLTQDKDALHLDVA